MLAPRPLPPYGMIRGGNIDPHRRPVVRNPDGTISTVRTISAGFDDGEVLLPTVSPDGRVLSDEEAIRLYEQSGQNFGSFRSPEAATHFAERLHNSQAEEYSDMATPPLPRPQQGFNLASFFGDPKVRDFASTALTDLGYGLTQGVDIGDALGEATRRTAELAPQRDAYALARKDREKKDQQYNSTIEAFKRAGRDDLVAAAEAGQMGEAWNVFLKGTDPLKPIEVNGQLVNPTTGEVLGDYRTPETTSAKPPAVESRFNPETGLEEKVTWNPATGAWDAFGGTKAPTRANAPMSPTVAKELFEAEDAVTGGDYVLSALDQAMSINDTAYDGPLADIRGDAMALTGDKGGVATAQLKNLTTELALTQLKTIFGGMPTEGERNILIQLQGSVNQPKAVRAEIFKRAKEMAIRRIEDNKAKAAGLRSGDYFEEGYGQQPAGGTTAGGLQWSIEP
jgi:hypothetical protein